MSWACGADDAPNLSDDGGLALVMARHSRRAVLSRAMTGRDRKDSRRRTQDETRHPEFRNRRNDVARWAAGWPARALVVLGVVALGARGSRTSRRRTACDTSAARWREMTRPASPICRAGKRPQGQGLEREPHRKGELAPPTSPPPCRQAWDGESERCRYIVEGLRLAPKRRCPLPRFASLPSDPGLPRLTAPGDT
jgi:hypothetical protein